MSKIHLKKSPSFIILLILTTIIICGCGGGGGGKKVTAISELKGANWQSYIGKEVIVEGVFVASPVHLLVSDINLLLANTRMPDEEFILLAGEKLQQLNPDKLGGNKLQITGIAKAADPNLHEGQNIVIHVSSYRDRGNILRFNPKIASFDIKPWILGKNRYAVLFSGGYDGGDNHVRYWNDLKFMYATLVNRYRFDPDNIIVIYGTGIGSDTQIPVHYRASLDALHTAFNHLKSVTDEYSTIFFFTTNHGGGFKSADTFRPHRYGGRFDSNGDEGDEGILEPTYRLDFNADGDRIDSVSWDEELCAWGSVIYDDEFRNILTEDLKYAKMIIVMEQCFSAGPILDMAGPNRIIMSAAGQYEFSWAMPPDYQYDEFSYHFTCAINEAKPDGTPVDADANDDGVVSMVEAFNYARSNDTRPETPHYEDNGDGIPSTGNMPAGDDGAFGAGVSLHWE